MCIYIIEKFRMATGDRKREILIQKRAYRIHADTPDTRDAKSAIQSVRRAGFDGTSMRGGALATTKPHWKEEEER